MIINVIENDENNKLKHYLGILEILYQLIFSYYSYEINYQEFIFTTKLFCDKIKINDLFFNITSILEEFPNMRVIYSNSKYRFITINYKFIIRKYNSRNKNIKKIITKIFTLKDIYVDHILSNVTSYIL